VTRAPLRWAVLRASLGPTAGHEQSGVRPVVVVSHEPFHQLGLATVVPVTSARTSVRLPGDVPVREGEGGLRAGVIICSQLRTVPIHRLHMAGQWRHVTSPAVRSSVRDAIAQHLALDLSPPADGASGHRRYALVR
jgi:mRNA interferase ChpB